MQNNQQIEILTNLVKNKLSKYLDIKIKEITVNEVKKSKNHISAKITVIDENKIYDDEKLSFGLTDKMKVITTAVWE